MKWIVAVALTYLIVIGSMNRVDNLWNAIIFKTIPFILGTIGLVIYYHIIFHGAYI